MKLFRWLLLLICCTTFFSHGLAQGVKGQLGTSAQLSVTSSADAPADRTSNETAILRTQVEESRRFQEQILNTVWWALGCVVAIAALLVGYGWFTNQKAYERDKKALSDELRQDLANAKADLAKTAQIQQDAATKRIQQLMDQKFEEIKRGVQKQIAEISDEMLDLQLAQKNAEREDWLRKGSHRNALSMSIECLSLSVARRNEYETGESLDLVSVDVHKLIEVQSADKNFLVDSFLLREVISTLDTVKDSHSDIAQQVRQKVLT